MHYKVLLAESEHRIRELLEYNLLKDGFKVITANSETEILMKLVEQPDIVVFNIDLPDDNALELCNKIREENGFEKIPIVLLTNRINENNEIQSLEAGVDDVISIPVSAKKFVARIKSNLRKIKIRNEESLPKIIQAGKIEIDKERFVVIINNNEISFPRREFELLFFLASHPGYVFNRDTILYKVWGDEIPVIDRTVDVHIRKIRIKLGEFENYIKTIKGVGYTFKVEKSMACKALS